jgi:D-tyrosyl-tRNA(Tyr) deacylase
MRLVIQRVREAGVAIEAEQTAKIGKGLLLLLGVEAEDELSDIEWLVQKTINMRIFSDEEGKMNRSLTDVKGELLIVSQFTLHASTKKGNRPSFIKAAPPEQAEDLYRLFITHCRQAIGESKVQSGIFGANMQVSLINDGPVTIIMDSKNRE